MSDATVLFRDIAGDAAQNAANRVNPSQEQLSQIDRPAADDTWHDVPDVSRGNFRDQVKSKLDSGKNAAQQVTGDATQAAHPGDSRDPAAAADLAVKDYRNTGNTGGANVLEGARAAADSTKQKIAESVPEDHKERTRYWQDRSREYLRGKVPQERREQIIWRLKKTVVEIQGHQDCTYRACPFLNF